MRTFEPNFVLSFLMAKVVRGDFFIHSETESSLCATQLRIVFDGFWPIIFNAPLLRTVSSFVSDRDALARFSFILTQLVRGLKPTLIHILGLDSTTQSMV